MRPGQAFHDTGMGFDLKDFVSGRKVPDFHYAVTTTTGKSGKGRRIFLYLIHSIYMPSTELANEGFGKHTLQLGGVESSRVFSASCQFVGGLLCLWMEYLALSKGCAAGSRFRG